MSTHAYHLEIPLKSHAQPIQIPLINPLLEGSSHFLGNLLTRLMIHFLPGLVISYIAIQNGPVEIVDLPIKHGDFP